MYNAELIGNKPDSLPATVAELLENICSSRSALEALIDQLSEAQLLTPATDTGWSVKDQMAHIAIWESGIDGLLQRRSRFGAMGLDEADVATHDIDGLNDILIERSRRQSLAEVVTFFNDSHRQLMATLGALADEDLFNPYRHYEPDQLGDFTDRPVINWIAGNTYEHYAEHYPLIEKLLA